MNTDAHKITLYDTDSLHDSSRDFVSEMTKWSDAMAEWNKLSPEEQEARRAQIKADELADDLARGPVKEMPPQDPATPTLYVVLTDEAYDRTDIHGAFTSLVAAQEFLTAQMERYATLPKARQSDYHSIVNAEVQTWTGREQGETWEFGFDAVGAPLTWTKRGW